MRLQSPLRIGLFGGAFDPPHLAHVALAKAVIQAWDLTALHVLPTGHAWHRSQPLTPWPDRLAMTELALGGIERVIIDERELNRPGPTYTIDTILELASEYPGAELVLQIGADQALFFYRWHRAQEIAQLCSISIFNREVNSPSSTFSMLREEQEGTQQALAFNRLDPLPGVVLNRARVRVLDLPPLPHSSTQIRQRAALGLPIDHLVPPAVGGYIAKHHLYQIPP